MAILVIFATVFALSMGIAILLANPRRFTNQAFAVTAFIAAARSLCTYYAIGAGNLYVQDHVTSPIPLLRIGAAVAAFVPWMLWILKESLVAADTDKLKTIRRSLPWLGLSAVLAMACFTESYISSDSLPGKEHPGPGYVTESLILVMVYTFLIGQTWGQMRRQSGIRRIEMQFLVLNTGVVALLAVGLSAIGRYFHLPTLQWVSTFSIITAYTLGAWAVTYYRIFDVRQVFLSLTQRVGLVCLLTTCICLLGRALDVYLPQSAAYILSIAFFASLSFWLDRSSRAWMGIDGERKLAQMRSAVIEIASSEPHPEKLSDKFASFLCKECRASFGTLVLDQGGLYSAGGFILYKDRPGYAALCEKGWATPESLVRRRATPRLTDLRSFLEQNLLGLLIAVPRGSQTPTLLIAFGTKMNEWPFTYPEVLRLQNIAELMDNILTRSRLTLQAAMRAKMEQLTMISRGLAHDLNNLITPVSSFLVHTDGKFPVASPEREVHAAAQRSVRIITDYVREALFFSARLRPKFEQAELARIFRDVRALMATRAGERAITLVEQCEYCGFVTADAVLILRMLANVVGNAIDASNAGQVVTLEACCGRAGWYCLRVTDQGHGIAPENLRQIFEPYFTTKNYGDAMRGFGLGLTICQKIVELHGGTISVSSQLGLGTTMTIDLPISQNEQAPAEVRADALVVPARVVAKPALQS